MPTTRIGTLTAQSIGVHRKPGANPMTLKRLSVAGARRASIDDMMTGDSSSSSSNTATLVRRRPLIREGSVRVKYGLRWSRTHAQLRGSVLFLGDTAHEVSGATLKNEREFRVQLVGEERLLKVRSDTADEWARALTRAAMTPPTTSNFSVLKAIGRGGGGEVYLVRRKDNSRLYAMKVVQKIDAFSSASTLRHALDERLCLELARSSPFIVRLEHAFQDERALYHVTEFCRGGDLRQALQRHPKRRFTEKESRRIFAQLVLAVQHLHSLDILYRDLKPDNVLLSEDGQDVRLCDFGLAKILTNGRFGRTRSFCGTSQFMAPEMVRHRSYGIAVDLWGLGALFYQVLIGHAPFNDIRSDVTNRRNQAHEIYDRIQLDDLILPNWLSDSARDMLTGLLHKREEDRWNMSDLIECSFFDETDWDALLEEGRMKRLRRQSGNGRAGGVGESSANIEQVMTNFATKNLTNLKAFKDEEISELKQHANIRKLRQLGGGLMKKPNSTDIVGFGFSDTSAMVSSSEITDEEEDISDKISPLKIEELDDFPSFRSFSKLKWRPRSSTSKYIYTEF